MKHILLIILAAALAPVVRAQAPGNTAGAGEFPGLQILPPGSEIEGISLPRYENHRVSALLKAGKLKVVSRTIIELKQVAATLYGEDGNHTTINTGGVVYDFRTQKATTTDDEIVLTDKRFTARGKQVLFDTRIQRGILLGPVHTTVSQAAFNKETNVTDKK